MCGRNSRDKFIFKLTDERSGGKIVEVEIEPHAMIMALTGMADQPCIFHVNKQGAKRAGLRRIIKGVGIDRIEASDRAQAFKHLSPDHPHREGLVNAFNKWVLYQAVGNLPPTERRIPAGDWLLSDNGVGRKQDGREWQVTLVRFEPFEKES